MKIREVEYLSELGFNELIKEQLIKKEDLTESDAEAKIEEASKVNIFTERLCINEDGNYSSVRLAIIRKLDLVETIKSL